MKSESNIHYMTLDERYFNAIKKGTKIYEIRIHDTKRKKILIDSLIEFKNKNNPCETLTCRVEEIIIDDSFKKIIEFCGLKNVMPNDFTGSVDDVVQIYEKIPHNELLETYKEASLHFGIVAFKINCVA